MLIILAKSVLLKESFSYLGTWVQLSTIFAHIGCWSRLSDLRSLGSLWCFWVMCFEINTFLITSKEKFTTLLYCLLCFMGVCGLVFTWRLILNRLVSINTRCVRSICRVSLHHALHSLQRLNVMDIDSYYHNQILHWAGHFSWMPMLRLLTGLVACRRPNGCPEVRHEVRH